MRVPGLKTLKKRYRQWRSRFVNGGIILGYHRVAEVVDDPFGICVSPAHFAEQMAYLRHHMHPLPLPQMVERALSGTLPPRAVAVTFDDGYADALHTALPILSQHEIPATLFVVSGLLGGEPWWDELVRLVQSRPQAWWKTELPNLEKWDLLSIYQWLLSLEEADRQSTLVHLWHKAGGKQPGKALMLTEDELVQLAASGWWQIGAHTITHPSLDRLTREKQLDELSLSRATLERLVGMQIDSCSYPNGRYSPETMDLARKAGYGLACASHADIVWSRSKRFCLPRVWISNAPPTHCSDHWLVLD